MESKNSLLSMVEPVSRDTAGASAPVSTIPQKVAEQSGAFGQAMMKLVTSPISVQRQRADAFSTKLEEAAFSFDRHCQETANSAQSVNAAMTEALKANIALAMHFFDDLAHVKGPSDVLRLQFGYVTAQVQLLTHQSTALLRELGSLFMAAANPK